MGATGGGGGGELCSGGDAQLGEDVAQVRLHGALGDEQPADDLGVGEDVGDEPDDLQLGGGEAVPAVGRAFASSPSALGVGDGIVERQLRAFGPGGGQPVGSERLACVGYVGDMARLADGEADVA